MKANRTVSVIAGLAILLFAGFVYAWSILSAPISEEFHTWTSTQLSLTFTICMSFFCLGGLVGGAVLNHVTPGFNVRVAAVLFLAGFLLASRAQSPTALYIGYGILCGTASGFAYNAVISSVPRYYPGRQGLISGILLMGFGASSLIIGTAFTSLTPIRTGAWRTSLLVLGVLMAAILTVCSFFLPKPERQTSANNNVESVELTPGQLLRIPSFWCFFLWATLMSAVGLSIIGQARPLLLSVEPSLSAGSVSLIVGMISVCNGLGRILVGALFDRFGHRIALPAVWGFLLAGGTAIVGAAALRSIALLAVGFAALGLGYGGSPTSCAWVIRSFYGSRHYSVNFSMTNLNLLIASFGSTAVGALYDASKSYTTTFMFLFACIAAAAVAMVGVRRPRQQTLNKEKNI